MLIAMPLVSAELAPEPALVTAISVESPSVPTIADVVRDGLSRSPKQLPPWLFYDEAGSELFEEITRLPEYYLTRTERSLLADHASEMIAAAADGSRLRLVELGAGSADKTRTLLSAALEYQREVEYLPVDVSESALELACSRIEAELPGVAARPVVGDFTVGWAIPEQHPDSASDRQLLLWIGSSIGNFEPEAAVDILRRIQQTMRPGDGLLLGADLAPRWGDITDGCKCIDELIAAYDDAAGVTAAFNRNMLERLNRELGAEFDTEQFLHRAVWNKAHSRIEMHLESRKDQSVWIEALEMTVDFAVGESIHTENSYKYTAEQVAGMMALAGFPVERHWLANAKHSTQSKQSHKNGSHSGHSVDPESAWFAVLLGRRA